MNEYKTGFGGYNYEQLAAFAEMVFYNLTQPKGVAAFPSPDPSLEELQSATGALRSALIEPNSKVATALRKEARANLIDVLKALAAYLERKANKDPVKLEIPGFELKKKPMRSVGDLPAPQNARFKHTGFDGEVQGQCDPLPLANSFEVRYTLDPDSGVYQPGGVYTNSRRMIVRGLIRGKDHYLQIRGTGANGSGAWSDIVKIMVI